MKKNSKFNFLKSFILKNVNSPDKGYLTKFWAREMKIAKELYEEYPDKNFWNNMDIGFKLNSLSWFKMKKGFEFLDLKYKEFKFVPTVNKKTLDVSSRKFGDTLHNNKTPKFIKDFL